MVCESGKKRVRSESKRQAEVVDISAAGGDVATALDGEDVTDESLLKVKKDVAELAEKVMRFRETGPTAFASLVEKSLAQIRPSLPMSTAADYTSATCLKPKVKQIGSLALMTFIHNLQI